ncbi:dephospho-CoA kinase [Anaerofustis sp.]|uniref:dephospho-CoA kinase n=1 Tax=Anaerofustis sp. TaxID=1872517 RepID=UPI0025C04ABA|nr:dephospho-CoA kinase [Anaerofustis sp.]
MKVIGLTGSIGTGKSTASKILKKEFDIPIIDADVISREAVQKGSIGILKIKDAFGSDFILNNGELNRVKMGNLVFNDNKARELLESIIHPVVMNRYDTLVRKYKEEGHSYVVYDCPLLIEEDLIGVVDVVMLIYSNKDIQLQRVMLRDNLTEEEALKRIYSQMSIDEKKRYADIVIDNSGTVESLREKIGYVYDNKFSKKILA